MRASKNHCEVTVVDISVVRVKKVNDTIWPELSAAIERESQWELRTPEMDVVDLIGNNSPGLVITDERKRPLIIMHNNDIYHWLIVLQM